MYGYHVVRLMALGSLNSGNDRARVVARRGVDLGAVNSLVLYDTARMVTREPGVAPGAGHQVSPSDGLHEAPNSL